MRNRLAAMILAIHGAAYSQEEELEKVARKVTTQGEVCADPAQACDSAEGFKPNELPFRIGKKFAFDRGEDRSPPFYAVILKSAKLCEIEEKERLELQAQFPHRKVFVHRFHCDDFAD